MTDDPTDIPESLPNAPPDDAPLSLRVANKATGYTQATLLRWEKKGWLRKPYTLGAIRAAAEIAAAQGYRFGHSLNELSLEEAGQLLGITREWVRRLQARGDLPRPLTRASVEAEKKRRAELTRSDPPPSVDNDSTT